MTIPTLDHEEARAGLRAMMTVARADGNVAPSEVALVAAASQGRAFAVISIPSASPAFARGRAVNRDLSRAWDFWSDMARPLDDVRRDLGVPPP